VVKRCTLKSARCTVALCPRRKDRTIKSSIQEISLSKIYYQLIFEVSIQIFKIHVMKVIGLYDIKIIFFWGVTPCVQFGGD
jgi:hypothetical protein